MRLSKDRIVAGLVLPLLLALSCSGGATLKTPPQPEDLDQLEPALAEWVWRGVQRVENNPGDFMAYFSLCQIYDANELYEIAMECYERTVAAEPARAKAWYFLARARWRNEDRSGAIESMNRSIERFAHYAPAHARLGRWQLQLGDLDSAEASFERVRDIDPDEPVGGIGLAQVMLARENPAAAIELLKEVLGNDPEQAAALVLLEVAQRQSDGESESVEDLQLPLTVGRMLGNDPWAAELDLFVVGYSARLNVADEYLANAKPEAAADVLEAFLVDEPGNLRAMNKLGLAYLRLARYDDAKTVLTDALALDPDNYRAHLEMASVFMLTGDSGKALDHADRVIELKPDLGLAHSRRGAILRGMTRYADAIEAFGKAEQLSPDEKMIPRVIGDCYTRLSDWKQAAASYERALKLDATDPELYSRVGFTYVKLGRLAEAEEAFTQALVHDSPQAEAVKKMLAQVQRIREAS